MEQVPGNRRHLIVSDLIFRFYANINDDLCWSHCLKV